MFIKHIHIVVSLAAGRQQTRLGPLDHQIQLSISEGEASCVMNLSYLAWAMWLKMPLVKSARGWLSH